MLKVKSLLCAMLALALISVLPAPAEGLRIQEQGGKYALADESGFLLTDYIYDFIQSDLYEPPFAVKRNGHCGFIDASGSEVKLLAVDGVEPTEPNIRNGSYPITSTLYATRLKGNDNPNVVALLEWIASPQGMELVEKSGYTPWEE